LTYITSLIFAPQQTIVDDYMLEDMKKQGIAKMGMYTREKICWKQRSRERYAQSIAYQAFTTRIYRLHIQVKKAEFA